MDHCHATGEFRGWLCLRCNGVLGFIDTHSDKINAYLSPQATECQNGLDT